MFIKRREWLSFSLVLLLAAALRFWGITHDVWIDENKVVNPSIGMAQAGGIPFFHAPHSYYPHFVHHILAAVFWPIAKIWPEFSNDNYHFIARGVAALFDIAIVGIVFLIGRRLWGYWGGTLAALFLTVMPLHVKYSHFMQVDLVAAFFMTLALWSALKIWDEGKTKWYILTGVFVGAAGAAQFWGLTAGAALVLAQFKIKKVLKTKFLLGLIAIPLTFIAFSPHLVFQWPEYRETFQKIRARGAAGDLGYTRANILWPLYAKSPDWGLNFTRAGLIWESNVLIFALAVVGGVIAAVKKDWKIFIMLGVFVVILYLAINGTLKLYAIKRLMPLGPVLALLAAYVVTRRPVLSIAGAAGIVWALVQVIGFDLAYAQGSVHEESVQWAEANIPHQSVVLQPGPLRLLDPTDERWHVKRMAEVYANFNAADPEVARDRAKSLDEWIQKDGVQYVVLDSRIVDRYYDATSQKLYPETTASYQKYFDDVRSRGELLFEIGPRFGRRAGARVEIYDVRADSNL